MMGNRTVSLLGAAQLHTVLYADGDGSRTGQWFQLDEKPEWWLRLNPLGARTQRHSSSCWCTRSDKCWVG
jgi:hypothetical protein